VLIRNPAIVWLLLVAWRASAATLDEGHVLPDLSPDRVPGHEVAAQEVEPSVLTSASQVHQLSRAEASQARRTRIRGVVTCSWPNLAAIVVQDATRGIYIDELPCSAGACPQVGDRVEVEGVTTPAEFAPQVHAQRITRLGGGELPQPLRPSRDELSNGSLHTQYVEIQGVVTATSVGGLTLLMPGGRLRILLFDLNEAAMRVAAEDARIRLRGVVGASFDPVTQRFKGGEVCLFAPEIQVEELPPADLFTLPPKRVSELLLFDPLASALRRVKITGQVVHQRDDETYLMDGTNGLRFTQREFSSLALGAVVEVVGFPMWTGPTPRLQEAVVRQTGRAALPVVLRVTGEDLFQIEHDAVRVRVEAMLLNESSDGRTLELQAHLRRFVARLDRSQSPLPLIPPGSRLELVGVHAGRGMALTPRAQFDSCELLLGSPADVRVLARPAWWTWWRWLVLVLVLGVVLAAALVWIRFLRRQVLERTSRLREEIRVREQAEHQRSLAQERARIARDLHDDLGSTLTEIAMLATPPARSAAGPGEGPDRLGMIAQRSRMLVHALDATVWAVDPRRDTLESLAHYLASYAEECLRGVRIACRVQIPNAFPERIVPGQVRHHVFLAVKEALNNAVRHSGASEVLFRLRVDGDSLALSIVDNGCGFNPAAPGEGDGLPNLRDRMRDLGGRCRIESAADRGTTVSLEIPLPVPNRVS
jgi:signal transduction histidine kinase